MWCGKGVQVRLEETIAGKILGTSVCCLGRSKVGETGEESFIISRCSTW
jgi:hypothetical protein